MIKPLYHMGHLYQIVVDDAHLTFSSDTFCPSMAAMNRIRPETIEVPIVLMSATPLKKIERKVLASHGSDFNRAVVIVENLTRKNNSICVEDLNNGANKEMMEAACNKKTTILYSPDIYGCKHDITVLARSQCEQL